MSKTQKEFLEKFPKGGVNESLKRFSTFRVGGKADYFYKLEKEIDLPKLLEFALSNQIPYLIIGGGSNILFDDKGFRGLIIKMDLQKIKVINNKIQADAGVSIAKLIKVSLEKGLLGLEKWFGLPGTVGGAIRGNAGYNGLETKDILFSAKIFDPKLKEYKTIKKNDLNFSYRHSSLKQSGDIVISGIFQLKKGTLQKEEQERIMKESQKFRLSKQPLGYTAGSFFKNPSAENPAGMLIEKAGLKGKQIGGAQISPKHANFFMNVKNASAKDILALARLAKTKVKEQFKIDLCEEVQIFSEIGRTKL